MKKELLFLTTIIFLSGCTGGSDSATDKPLTTEGDYGLIISEFSTDFATMEEGDIATLLVELQNIDTEPAENIEIKIYPVGLEISALKSIKKESVLEPNDTTFFEFDVTAPDGLNIDRTYTPYAEICYNYKSAASTSVFIIDNSIYERDMLVPDAQKTSTTAPVDVSVSFTADLVKVEEIPAGRDRTLSISMVNVDNGYLMLGETGFPGSNDKHQINAGNLTLTVTTTGSGIITIVEDQTDPEFVCSNTKPIVIDDDSTSNSISNIVTIDEVDSNEKIYCTNLYDVSFGSTGSSKTMRLPINFNPTSGGQDVPYFKVDLDYRYCIQTEPITITATKII
ncbi:MAG: hypothetical protein GON13_03365 [Nanoarchaeota archaeon]|nr:hypothetical protein [Nanoarchaeota archaeon]